MIEFVIDGRLRARNIPNHPIKSGYMVARAADAELWYYGLYETYKRAEQIAIEIGNGIVVEIKEENNGQSDV